MTKPAVRETTAQMELMAWMCSRLGHDLVNPLGAMMNGLELLQEDDDALEQEEILELVNAAGRRLLSKLNFFRLAFGAGSASGGAIRLEEIHAATQWMREGEAVALNIAQWREDIPRRQLKLLLQMLLLARSCIPRGGEIAVCELEWENSQRLVVSAKGVGAKPPEGISARLQDAAAMPEDIHAAQLAFTARLLASMRMHLVFGEEESGKVVLYALPE